MDHLFNGWQIGDPWGYAGQVLLYSIGLRIVLSLLGAIKFAYEDDGKVSTFIRATWGNFIGFHPRDSGRPSNYWYTFILGTFELAAYPIFIVTGAWTVIGAWIGLKTLAQWSVWTTDRAVFNLFLIGNLAVLCVAFFALSPLVTNISEGG